MQQLRPAALRLIAPGAVLIGDQFFLGQQIIAGIGRIGHIQQRVFEYVQIFALRRGDLIVIHVKSCRKLLGQLPALLCGDLLRLRIDDVVRNDRGSDEPWPFRS